MRRLKSFVGSWDWRAIVSTTTGLAAGLILVALINYLEPTSVQDFGVIGIAGSLLLVLSMGLRRLVKRPLPISRVKHTVEMSLIDIMDEFTYTGYRVEAMTENTVVLVRFSINHLILGALLLSGLCWIPLALIMANDDAANELAVVAIFVAIFSFVVVYMYSIAGYGYDRIVFNQKGQDNPATCVTFANAFLPSRVDLAIVSTEDHGDKEWYTAHPNRL